MSGNDPSAARTQMGHRRMSLVPATQASQNPENLDCENKESSVRSLVDSEPTLVTTKLLTFLNHI